MQNYDKKHYHTDILPIHKHKHKIAFILVKFCFFFKNVDFVASARIILHISTSPFLAHSEHLHVQKILHISIIR